MDLQFHGANCVTIHTKNLRITVDDTLADLGGVKVAKADDMQLFTGPHPNPAGTTGLVIDQPGEYEVSGVAVYGIAARSHLDEEGKKNATMYKVIFDEISVLITGHIYPELTDVQLEKIGSVAAMVVPVGGNGYTLDGIGALKLIKQVEPKLVIPTHFDSGSLKYPVPQQSLSEALKALGMEPMETVEKLRLKAGNLESATQLVVLR